MAIEYHSPEYYEARKLRKQGLSGKQIADQLGVGLRSVYKWIEDVELTREQKKALQSRKTAAASVVTKKHELQLEARRLRQEEGLSVKGIAKLLGVTQSSISVWVRDIKLSEEQLVKLKENAQLQQKASGHKGSQANIVKFREARELYQAEGRIKAKERDPLHVAGCMLYWAEGTKSRTSLSFGNSDPEMIVHFMRFLRESLAITDDEIVVRAICYLNNGLSLEEIESYWLNLMNLPHTCLRKSTVNLQPKSSQQKGRKLLYGLCTINIYDFRVLHHVYGAIQEYIGIDKPLWLE